MQAMIRLRRGGKRHQASFRIVVAQKSEAADGDYMESLGTYNPRTQPSLIKLDAARALHWLHLGARPSDTVRSILRRTGVWEKYHEGAGPDDLAPDEKTVFQGPEGMKATTSRRAQQAEAAAEAEPEAAEPEAEAADEPSEPEAEAEAQEERGSEEPEGEAAEEEEPEEVQEAAADEEYEDEPVAEAEEAGDEEPEAEEDEEADDEEGDGEEGADGSEEDAEEEVDDEDDEEDEDDEDTEDTDDEAEKEG